MAVAFLGLFALSAVTTGILYTLMLREMRSATGRWLLIFLQPFFVDKSQFTEKGLRLRRCWFIALGLTVLAMLALTQQS